MMDNPPSPGCVVCVTVSKTQAEGVISEAGCGLLGDTEFEDGDGDAESDCSGFEFVNDSEDEGLDDFG